MSFVISAPPVDPKDLTGWVTEQLESLAEELETLNAKQVEFRYAAPAKPREGMLYGADGTNWNPGSGKGVYCYYTGAWHFLG